MVPILDNGHGGVIDGIYQTAGKRSPNWECGVLYEGDFNRYIIDGVIARLKLLHKPYHHVSPELTDTSLKTRVNRANKIHRKDNSTYLVSVHANAGGGTGWEIFTSVGETKSDYIATKFGEDFRIYNDLRERSDYLDGDLDKESNFYVLRKTMCPAILIECGFMDHKVDYERLWSIDFRENIIESLVQSILKLYDE